MFTASSAASERINSKASTSTQARANALRNASKSKAALQVTKQGILPGAGLNWPTQLSEDVGSLIVWLDRVVVKRLEQVDERLVYLQRHVAGLAIDSDQHVQAVVRSRGDSRALQMPSGDHTVDMDYSIPVTTADCIFGPDNKLPKAGPPTTLLEGLHPVWSSKGDGGLSNEVTGTGSTRCNSSLPANSSLHMPSGDQSVDMDYNIPIAEPKPASHKEEGSPRISENSISNSQGHCSSSATRSFRRRPSVSSVEDQAKLAQKIHNTRPRSWREMTWSFLDDPESSCAASRYLNGMVCITLLAVCVSLLQSTDSSPLRGTVEFVVESCFESVFLLEFALRLIACPDRMTFAVNMHNVFDLAAALPLAVRIYVFLDSRSDDSIARNLLVGIVPMLRVLKTLRGFKQFQLLLAALELCLEAVPICLFAMLGLTLMFSGILFIVEPRDNIVSFPHAMWLTIVTTTTLGYGDVTPSTTPGYLVISVMVVSSVMFMAMPLGIIGQAFTTVWQERDRILLVHGVRNRLRVWGYKPTDIPDLFQWFDDDDSGELGLPQFKHMIEQMQIGLSDMRIKQLFNSIDINEGGTIDDREFVQALFPQYFQQIFGEDQPEVDGTDGTKPEEGNRD